MSIRQHGPHLYQLTRFGSFNSYLLRDGDTLTAIDTGLSGARTITHAARLIGLPITRLLITHAHADHASDLDTLHTQHPDLQTYVSTRDARFLGGERHLDPHEQLPGAALRGSYVTTRTTPTRTLQDGDQIGPFLAVATPGHTPGHLAYLDTRDGTLIAGDAYQTATGTAVSGDLKPLFPFPALATWHAPTALQSARRLQGLNPTRLAVGHGPVLDHPTGQMQAAADHLERRLTRN